MDSAAKQIQQRKIDKLGTDKIYERKQVHHCRPGTKGHVILKIDFLGMCIMMTSSGLMMTSSGFRNQSELRL